MDKLRLLFVDDEETDVNPALRRLKGTGAECRHIQDFDAAIDQVTTILPDMVILDLVAGDPSEGEDEGSSVFAKIWERRFCPIIFFSARLDILSDTRADHPFIRQIKKGPGGVERLMNAIAELRPHAAAMRTAEDFVLRKAAEALRDVATYAFRVHAADEKARDDAIIRSGRRRLAALMDNLSAVGGALASWEQYVIPPVSEHAQLGDILRKATATSEDPTAFRLVLTPSCDLVATKDRAPKVKSVLVARCCPPKKGIAQCSWGKAKANKLGDKIKSMMLRQGYCEGFVPLAGVKDHIPTMMADLRDLRLIPFRQIGAEGRGGYVRIASLDSPFRELIAWAYMQSACRPGLPDRDYDAWWKEIENLL